MKEELKILILEDSADDAEIVLRLLKKEMFHFEHRLVMTKDTYLQALEQFQPDLILADNSLPQFNAIEALKIIKQRALNIPFIMVTGTTSEEFAAAIIKFGAADYVLKDRLARLPSAIEAALKQKKAEEAAKASEEQRKLIMNAALDAIICMDTKGIITFWNPQAEKIFGWKAQEAVGQILAKIIIPPAFRESHTNGMENYLQTGNGPILNTLLELTAINRECKEFPIEITVLPIKQGTEESFCAFIRDITERKRTEQELSREKQLLRTLIDNLPDYIYVKDIELRHIVNNAANIKLIGALSEEETLGKTAFDYFESELAQQYIEDDRFILESKQPLLNKEEPILTNTGEKRWLLTTKLPIQDKAGNITGLVGISRDITAQKISEQKIISEKEFSNSIINSLPGIFYLYDENGKFLRWNKNFETVSGYTSEEISQMHPLDFFDTGEKGLLTESIGRVFKVGMAEVEAHFLTKSQKKIAYYFNGWAAEFENKTCLIGMGIDITERKRTEAALNQSYKEIRQLASHLQEVREEERAGIAREIHDELGQQITGLKMDVSWLSKKIITEDYAIKEKIKDILDLLDNTVKTVRKIATELRPSILDDLGLREAMEWQSQEFQKRSGIKIVFSSSLPVINATGNISIGLFRIYQESLTNVARHAEASVVTTTLEEKNSQLVLSITDNGKGFDINTSGSKKTLGLLGMKERTLMMGGEYEIISAPEKGTRVIVSVPYIQTDSTI